MEQNVFLLALCLKNGETENVVALVANNVPHALDAQPHRSMRLDSDKTTYSIGAK